MGLFDMAAKGKGEGPKGPPPAMAVSIKAEPIDVHSAGRKMLEAISLALGIKAPIHEKDVEDFVDAARLLDVAIDGESDEGDKKEPDDKEEGDDEHEEDEAAE